MSGLDGPGLENSWRGKFFPSLMLEESVISSAHTSSNIWGLV